MKTAIEMLARHQANPDAQADHVRVDVAEAVYVAMQSRGLTQAELARRLGMKRQQVSRVLSGEENLTLETLGRLAVALGGTWQVELTLTTT